MILVEQHIITNKHPLYDECANMTRKSKDLYNAALYVIRQHHFTTGNYIGLKNLYHIIKNHPSYGALPRKVSNQTLKQTHNMWVSWLKALTSYNKTPSKFTGKPQIPRYKPLNGHNATIYEKQAISKKLYSLHQKVALSQSSLHVPTKVDKWDNIKEARVIVKDGYYVIEIVYSRLQKTLPSSHTTISAIDLGMNNLACVAHNDPSALHFAINGKPAKSINQFYNKKIATLKSKLPPNQKTSKKIKSITAKRNRKLTDFMHKASREVVNQLVEAKCRTLIIGKNIGMKQDITLNTKTAQNFINIPTYRFAAMVEYKAKLEGMEVRTQEESYTSKTSFLDYEGIRKQVTYKGRRKHRGLFVGANGAINADSNGAYNIMEKAVSGAVVDRLVMPRHPKIISIRSIAGRGHCSMPIAAQAA